MPHSTAYTPPNLDGYNVLLVEDDADVREFMITVLERTDAKVLIAEDGLQAMSQLQHVGKIKIDLIILDYMLPGINGNEIITRLQTRPELAAIPLIVVSAFHECVNSELCKHIIPKPPKVSELFAKINELIKR